MTAAGHPCPGRRRLDDNDAIRCVIPRTATVPAYRNRQRAGDVIGVGYANRTDNAPWSLAVSAPPVATAADPLPPQPPPAAEADGSRDTTARTLVGWLAAIPRCLGAHLFGMGDAEAYWRGWQITSVYGGLGRRYRDPLFTTLRLS